MSDSPMSISVTPVLPISPSGLLSQSEKEQKRKRSRLQAAETANQPAEQTKAAPLPPPTPERASSVDPDSAEHLLSATHLGQRIKRLRLKRSMGLVELGKLTGLSASFLSQLETARVVPTLRNLARISLVFGKDLSYFFEAENQSVFRVQRKKDRVRLTMGAPVPSYITESFGILIPEGGLRPCMAEFLSGEERASFVPERYAGVEMVYVLDGELEVERNGQKYALKTNDLLYLSGETSRSYRCQGATPVQTLVISFDDERSSVRRVKK